VGGHQKPVDIVLTRYARPHLAPLPKGINATDESLKLETEMYRGVSQAGE